MFIAVLRFGCTRRYRGLSVPARFLSYFQNNLKPSFFSVPLLPLKRGVGSPQAYRIMMVPRDNGVICNRSQVPARGRGEYGASICFECRSLTRNALLQWHRLILLAISGFYVTSKATDSVKYNGLLKRFATQQSMTSIRVPGMSESV